MNIKRNEFRFRRPVRNRVRPFQSMTPQGEAVYAMREGWDQERAGPMQKKRRPQFPHE
jgi:hypothetical protein